MAVRLKVYGTHHVPIGDLDDIARSVRGMLIERVREISPSKLVVGESLQFAPGKVSPLVILDIKACPCLVEGLESGKSSLENEASRLPLLHGIECAVLVSADSALTDHDGHQGCA